MRILWLAKYMNGRFGKVKKLLEYMRKNPRAWLLTYIPIYLVWFVIAEHMVVDDYWVSSMAADDEIPFVPEFVVFYVLWYPYLLGSILYMYFRDHGAFVRYGIYLIITLSACLITFMAFPNGQNLRPEDTGSGICGWILERIYRADTNTNVLPSMHVVTCIGTIIAAFDSQNLHGYGCR